MPTWMNRTKEAEAARTAARNEQRQKAGNCIRCGFKRSPNSQQLCVKHLAESREKARKRYGVKPWKPGHRGRPPLSEQCSHNWDDTSPKHYRCVRCGKLEPR